MKATQKIVALGLSAALCVDALGAGAHVAPPSPPRCSADGTCHPKHNTWGHYGQRWRPWPGVEFTSAEPDGTPGTSVLGGRGYETPDPEEEERQAPPPLESSQPADEEEGTVPPADTPPLNLPPLPFQTPPAPPQENGQTPPPTLPFGQPTPPQTPVPSTIPTFRPLPGTEPVPAPGSPPRPTEVPLSPPGARRLPQVRPGQPATAGAEDAPPALPLQLTQRSAAPFPAIQPATAPRRLPDLPQTMDRGVLPAGTATTPGVQPRVLPAIYTPADDRPPALPAFR